MKYGKLTFVEEGPVYINPKGRKAKRWLCRCDCGKEVLVLANNVKRGRTSSCGCSQGIGKPAEERFWERVKKNSDCWLWTGPPTTSGYGRLSNRGDVLAHRFSWELHNGPIPNGLFVLHKCDNPLCVNPDHLFLGDHIDNMNDMISKDRSAFGKRNGNVKLTENQAMEIYESGETQRELAKRFNVSPSTISAIRNGRTWSRINKEI